MPIDPFLVELLVCPHTRQKVTPAKPALVAKVNAAIQAGTLKSTGGKPIKAPVEGLLLRSDRAVAYPIRDEIPEMLWASAIEISALAAGNG